MLKDHTWAERIVYPVIIPASCVTKKRNKKTTLSLPLSLSLCMWSPFPFNGGWNIKPFQCLCLDSHTRQTCNFIHRHCPPCWGTVAPGYQVCPPGWWPLPQWWWLLYVHNRTDICWQNQLWRRITHELCTKRKKTYMSHNWYNVTVIPALGRDRVVDLVCKGCPKAASLIRRLLSCSHSCVK